MKDEKLEVLNTNVIYAEDPVSKNLLMIHAWTNGEGFELNIAGNSSFQHMSICYSDFDLLKKMVKKLDKTPLSR